MKFFIEKNKDAGYRVTINIPKIIINDSLLKECIKISKTKNINGFRKGKIPINFIQKEYGDIVYYDVFKKLMQKFFYEVLKKEKIKIIGTPRYYIHENQDQRKEDSEYSVVYETYPVFKLQDIKNIEVNKIDVKITDSDIQNSVIKNKFQKFIWNKVNRPIKLTDRVTIDYCIYENTYRIKNFNNKTLSFIISNNTLIPELKDKIINHIMNDIIFFTINIHKLHPEQELQNKKITCKIKIIKIEEKKLQEINNKNIIQKKLQEINYLHVKKNLDLQINQITEKYLEDQIIEQIIEKNIILIPPLLFQQDKKNLYEHYKKKYQEENANILEIKYHYDIDMQVKKRLCMQIIIENIISDNQILLDEKNIQHLIKKISLNYHKPKEIIDLCNKNTHFKNTIKNIELKNQAMMFLKKRIKIIKKYWTFDDFINYQWDNYQDLVL